MVVIAYLAYALLYAILLIAVLQFGPLGIVPAVFITIAVFQAVEATTKGE